MILLAILLIVYGALLFVWIVVFKRSESNHATPLRGGPQILKPETRMKTLRDTYAKVDRERSRPVVPGETLRNVRTRRRVVDHIDMHPRRLRDI
jgi:hypothetical protein